MFAAYRSVVGILVALTAALGAPVAAQAADPPAPAIFTLVATDVTTTTATLHAKVITNGTPTAAYFRYGTTPDQLTLRTSKAPLGDGPGEVPLDVKLSRLTANTKYYVVAVAENDDWVVDGDPVEVTTLQPPEIVAGTVSDITYKSATLHFAVATHGQPTTLSGSLRSEVHIKNGVRSGGVTTALGPIPVAADGDVAIALPALEPGTGYTWTASVSGADLRARKDGGFRTVSLLFMPRPNVDAAVVPYGSHVAISGRVDRPGFALTLAEQLYPFTGPIAPLAGITATAGADGTYAFDLRVEHSAAYGVTGDGAAPLAAVNLTRVRAAAVVTAKVKRARGHRFVISGRYRPGVLGKASLYRRGAGRVGVAQQSKSGVFRFPARALRPGKYEIRVTPGLSTGFVAGKSATFTVPRR